MKIKNNRLICAMAFLFMYALAGCTVQNSPLQHFKVCDMDGAVEAVSGIRNSQSVAYLLVPDTEKCMDQGEASLTVYIEIAMGPEGVYFSRYCIGDEKKCEAITNGKKCPTNPKQFTNNIGGTTVVYDGDDAWCYKGS